MSRNFSQRFGEILKIKIVIMKSSPMLPVKKVLRMINSCQDLNQIEDCKIVIDNYVQSAKKRKLLNVGDLRDRLNEQLLTRQEELYLVKIFNSNI